MERVKVSDAGSYSAFVCTMRPLCTPASFSVSAKQPRRPWACASCIDSTATPEAVFAREVEKLQTEHFKPKEQLTLEPYERDHAVVVGTYRPVKKAKK